MKRAFLQRVAEADVEQIVFYIAEDNLYTRPMRFVRQLRKPARRLKICLR